MSINRKAGYPMRATAAAMTADILGIKDELSSTPKVARCPTNHAVIARNPIESQNRAMPLPLENGKRRRAADVRRRGQNPRINV
jgi:hypothetical protein